MLVPKTTDKHFLTYKYVSVLSCIFFFVMTHVLSSFHKLKLSQLKETSVELV